MDKKPRPRSLAQLINGEVRSQSKRNGCSSEGLQRSGFKRALPLSANMPFHGPVLEELIQLAKDIRAAAERGVETPEAMKR